MPPTDLITKAEAEELAVPEPASVVGMFERLATNPDVDVAKLEKLIEMQERILAYNAKAAFNAAFSKMQPDIPTIGEKAKTDKGTYAPREDIVEIVRPILSKHGFSLSFRTEWPETTRVKVVGILSHADGHSRESEFVSLADTSGSKNAIQALGSAVEYGRRYTTTDLLNIVTRKADDDGYRGDPKGPKTPDGFDEWWLDMTALTSEGTGALQAAWAASKPEYRRHVMATNKTGWEQLKRDAAKASRA